jgi:hypothetical protein
MWRSVLFWQWSDKSMIRIRSNETTLSLHVLTGFLHPRLANLSNTTTCCGCVLCLSTSISRLAPVLTHKDARGWISVSEKTSSRQFMNRGTLTVYGEGLARRTRAMDSPRRPPPVVVLPCGIAQAQPLVRLSLVPKLSYSTISKRATSPYPFSHAEFSFETGLATARTVRPTGGT